MSQFDVAIVGGGPAGLAAAAYLVRAARRSCVIIAGDLGGKVHYPFALRDLPNVDTAWGADLVLELEAFVREQQVAFIQQTVKRIDNTDGDHFAIHTSDGAGGGDTVAARAVILNTGATSKRTYVSGERDYWGRGVSFSAISHARHFAGRDVAVIGDGPRALVAALELAELAQQVYLITPRLQEFGELPSAQYVLAHPSVSLFQNWEVQGISGDEFVTDIQLVGINGEVRQLPVEGVFVQLELLPNNDMVRGLVEMDERGFIRINQRCETNVAGFFAAGDVTNVHAELVPVAVGEGAKAAVSALEYVVTHD
jgi:thioredoxin reductase